MSSKSPVFLEFEKPLYALEEQLERMRAMSSESSIDLAAEIASIESKVEVTRKQIFLNLTAWQRIQLARHPDRPYTVDYIQALFEDFQELHGDRAYRDDPAMVGGLATFEGQPVMVIGTQKGRETKEKFARNFGCPYPEGYRKALRLMRLAEKFQIPIVTFIDTAGAYPGVGAEERHVAEAIAVNIREMSLMNTPIVAFVIGEGGSGGALGIGVADRVYTLSNAYYSVISPEGCAAILWKDRASAPEAAEALCLQPAKLLELGIVDAIIEEPLGGAHRNVEATAALVGKTLHKALKALKAQDPQERLEARYQKFRALGAFSE